MKKLSIILGGVAFLAFGMFSCNKSCEGGKFDGALTNTTDSVSYALGVSIGENLKRSGFDDINIAALAKALHDVKDSSATLTMEQAGSILDGYMQKKQTEKADAAKTAGKTFLAENAKKAGVMTTPSGLQYEVVQEGTGKSPLATDKVKVHYHGTLVDGSVFDSSVDRGEPITFPLNGVIPGWTEGLQLMKEGGKYRFYIPSDLAYGDQAMGNSIPAGSTLIFDVELLEVNPAE